MVCDSRAFAVPSGNVSSHGTPILFQKMYFAEYDLCFFQHRHQMLEHVKKCTRMHPPGTEIYRNRKISMFEVWRLSGILACGILGPRCYGKPYSRLVCRLMDGWPRDTARICVTLQSSSSITRHYIGMWTYFSFMSCVNAMSEEHTLLGA